MTDRKPITIASLSEGENLRSRVLVFGTGPRQPGDEPRFITTQAEADEAFGIGRVTVPEPPPSVYATVVPVPPPAELPRGLYAETTAPAADADLHRRRLGRGRIVLHSAPAQGTGRAVDDA